MALIQNFNVEEKGTVYKILGNNAPEDMEITVYMENGRYRATSNYAKKPKNSAFNEWEPSSMAFSTEQEALENILKYFDTAEGTFVKIE